MVKRLFVVHGWEGTPTSDWLPWLKSEMEKEGFKVFVPEMPETDTPVVDRWVNHLSDCVGDADKNTYFVGHSIGGQAILRYIEGLNEEEKVGGVLLVAGWMHLTPRTFGEYADKDVAKAIAKPWLETPIKWKSILKHTSNITAIFSDNDPYVPLTDLEIFKEKLGARIVIEKQKGHINVERLASIKRELLLLSKDKVKV